MANMKRVCVLGNYSGRNAGDAAILSGLMRDISARYKHVEFVVPTLNPEFIRTNYRKYRVDAVSLAPWKGCLKFCGWPAWSAIRSSDLVLSTDAILFDRGLFNPIHNYLGSLAFLIPKAKKRGIPVVLYNVSLGPVRTTAGVWCLKRVLNSADMVILREEESRRVLNQIGRIAAPVAAGADCALSSQACNGDRVKEILRTVGAGEKKGIRIGLNINNYGDSFTRKGGSSLTKEKLLAEMEKTIRWAHAEHQAEIWLFGTQHMDMVLIKELADKFKDNMNLKVFSNKQFSHAELTGLFGCLDLLMGMRTHAIILASSVNTPVSGIVAYPKTYGYLKRLGQEKYAIDIDNLRFESMKASIDDLLKNNLEIRRELAKAIAGERKLASNAAELIEPFLIENPLRERVYSVSQSIG